MQRRIQTLQQAPAPTPSASDQQQAITRPVNEPATDGQSNSREAPRIPDQFLAPVALEVDNAAPLGPVLNQAGTRCSDKGFLPLSLGDDLQLLDWTGR